MKLSSLLFVVLLAGCVTQPGPAPLPPGGDACARACGRLRQLGCADGQPTDEGTSCETLCAHDVTEPEAQLTAAYLSCLAQIRECDEELHCER